MRTIITRKDGTVLWQSEDFDPAFARQVVPPSDHPALAGESEYIITNAPTVEEAQAIVAAPANTRGDVGMSVSQATDILAPVPVEIEPRPMPPVTTGPVL